MRQAKQIAELEYVMQIKMKMWAKNWCAELLRLLRLRCENWEFLVFLIVLVARIKEAVLGLAGVSARGLFGL